jgi:peptide/nickel transport system ATP-binding protein
MTDTPVLEVRDLTISAELADGRRVRVVDRVSFTIAAGETLGLVGESGSGKTMTSLAIMGLLPPALGVDQGAILLDGQNLLTMKSEARRRLRGKRMAMVMQDPLTALDPSFTIGSQVGDALHEHRRLSGSVLTGAVIESLEQVYLSGSAERRNQYPHQLSGGMRQRVTSAIALAGEPRLLIADEPTTALDVTTELRYLQLLRELQERNGFALLFVAHDLLVVRQICRRVAVMYSSQLVEEGPADAVFASPRHPYTDALIGAIPVLGETVELRPIEGQPPELDRVIVGCRFAARCPFAHDICRERQPDVTDRGAGRAARCFGTEPDGWIQHDVA